MMGGKRRWRLGKIVGANLRKCRAATKMSEQELAEAVNVNRTYLSLIFEHDELVPDLDILLALRDAFRSEGLINLSLDDFVEEDGVVAEILEYELAREE